MKIKNDCLSFKKATKALKFYVVITLVSVNNLYSQEIKIDSLFNRNAINAIKPTLNQVNKSNNYGFLYAILYRMRKVNSFNPKKDMFVLSDNQKATSGILQDSTGSRDLPFGIDTLFFLNSKEKSLFLLFSYNPAYADSDYPDFRLIFVLDRFLDLKSIITYQDNQLSEIALIQAVGKTLKVGHYSFKSSLDSEIILDFSNLTIENVFDFVEFLENKKRSIMTWMEVPSLCNNSVVYNYIRSCK